MREIDIRSIRYCTVLYICSRVGLGLFLIQALEQQKERNKKKEKKRT